MGSKGLVQEYTYGKYIYLAVPFILPVVRRVPARYRKDIYMGKHESKMHGSLWQSPQPWRRNEEIG